MNVAIKVTYIYAHGYVTQPFFGLLNIFILAIDEEYKKRNKGKYVIRV